MTIIAWKDGILAADSAIFVNDVIFGHARKIKRLANGTLIAAAGHTTECERFAAWATQTGDPYWQGFESTSEDDEFTGVIIEPDGHVIFIDRLGRALSQVGCECFAEGAAAELATGAMLAGASAAKAVEICVRNHAYAGGTVQVEPLFPPMEMAA